MLPVIQQLLDLQDRDQRIISLSKDLKNIPLLQERAKGRLADDEASVAAALGRVREVELKIKNLELDANTRRNTIGRLKEQQFATRKNEEFRAMGHEIERYEKEISNLEDQELELMDKLEKVKPDLTAAQQALSATKKSVDSEIAELTDRAKAIQDRLAELTKERTDLSANVEPDALAMYNRLLKSKGNSVVVYLDKETCQGCHMKVVLATIQGVREQKEITNCEQCGRVLYQG
jgi:predicted  nucleic acid-binding Zn-ribbon protein